MTLEEQVKFLTAENRAKDELIELLQQKLDYVLRQLHSPKSEKFDPNQLTLLDEESKKAEASSDETSAPEEANAGDENKAAKKRPASKRERRIKGLDKLPVEEEIHETLGSAYLQVDETPIRYLEPGTGKAPRGYLWLANDPHGSLFYHWGIGRDQEALIETIGKDYAGILQCDGWSAYEAYEGDHPEILFMSCLAHI